MSTLPDFDALWNYDRPAESERTFREVLEQTGENEAYQLELMTQIARAQGLQRQFEAGHATLNDVELRLKPEMARARVRYLLERGRLFNSAGDKAQAWTLFEQAWDAAQAAGEAGYAVDAAHMLGILETPELTWNLRALALAETSTDERARRWRASLYNNIGWTHHERGEYEEALALFQKALALREAEGKPEAIRIAKWMVARVLRSLGRLDEALAMQQALAADAQAAGDNDPYIQEELGECLLALGHGDEAKPHFAAAYAVLGQDDYLMKYEPERLKRMRELAG